MDRARDRRHTITLCALLFAATLALYGRLTQSDFITYDDHLYVTENEHVKQGLTWENLAWSFSAGPGHASNWHPVTWLSHMLDVQLFQLSPGAHHLTSVLLHAANSVLLLLVLKQLTGRLGRSAIVAALFALHPLHVESVAWISERKDVLSAFFFMLTLWAYGAYAKNRGERAEGRGSTIVGSAAVSYLLAILCFALGLMAKPMLVTLPFVLLLLDYWPLGRTQIAVGQVDDGGVAIENRKSKIENRNTLLLEKLPFFALTIFSSIMTIKAQSVDRALVPVTVLSLPARLENALLAYAGYLWKTIWPIDLAIPYSPPADWPLVTVLAAGALLVAITIFVIVFGPPHGATDPADQKSKIKNQKYFLTCWFWFLGMLIPVIGLVQVGMQSMADRYTYLPLIGIFIMVVWGSSEAMDRIWGTIENRKSKIENLLQQAIAAVALLGCALLTFRQVGFWRDSEALFAHTVSVTKDNYIALMNYGIALFKKGKLDEAAQQFETATALDPSLDAAWQKLGLIRGRQQKWPEAERALREALRVHGDDAETRETLGNVLLSQGHYVEALEHLEITIRLRPSQATAYNNLAICYKRSGRTSDAIASYRQALQLKPDSSEAANNLAWILATDTHSENRNPNEALDLATRACQLTNFQNPTTLATLAAAYAANGNFTEASSYIEQAQKLTEPANPQSVRWERIKKALAAAEPYRE